MTTLGEIGQRRYQMMRLGLEALNARSLTDVLLGPAHWLTDRRSSLEQLATGLVRDTVSVARGVVRSDSTRVLNSLYAPTERVITAVLGVRAPRGANVERKDPGSTLSVGRGIVSAVIDAAATTQGYVLPDVEVVFRWHNGASK